MRNSTWHTKIKTLLGKNYYNKCKEDIDRVGGYQKYIEKAQYMAPNIKGIPKPGIPLEGYGEASDSVRWYVKGISPGRGNLEVRVISSNRSRELTLPGDRVHFEYYGSADATPELLAFYDPSGENRETRGLCVRDYISGYAVVAEDSRDVACDEDYEEDDDAVCSASSSNLSVGNMQDVCNILRDLLYRVEEIEEHLREK